MKVISTRLPAFNRVVEFELEGANYWLDYGVDKHSWEWDIYNAEDRKLSREEVILLFKSDDDNISEEIDGVIALAEDFEADEAIKWRERMEGKK